MLRSSVDGLLLVTYWSLPGFGIEQGEGMILLLWKSYWIDRIREN